MAPARTWQGLARAPHASGPRRWDAREEPALRRTAGSMLSRLVRAYQLARIALVSGVVLVADCGRRDAGGGPDTS